MSIYQTKAIEFFRSGAQCAQAVFAALSDFTGLNEKAAMKLCASFGGGIARMREPCGALCGMLMALGAYFYQYPKDASVRSEVKDRHYRLTQYAAARFKQKSGSVFCYELLNLPHAAQIPVSETRTEDFYRVRPCEKYIIAAIEVFEELLSAEQEGTLESLISFEAAETTTKYLNEPKQN